MNFKFKTVVLSLLICLFWLLPAQAEDDNEGIARFVMITAKDGHDKTLIKAITEYHHWIANFEGHHRYYWYRIQTGPDTGKYIARTGGHNWADFDAEFDWQEEAGEVFASNVAPHIEKMEVQYTQEMTKFSHWPESFEGYTHFSIQEWYVMNGKNGKFREGLKKIVDTLKAANYPDYWGIMSVESGGYGNQLRIVGAHKGWSDLSEEDPTFFKVMSEALGGEEQFQTFMSEWGSTFKAGKNMMVKRMPEASDYGK